MNNSSRCDAYWFKSLSQTVTSQVIIFGNSASGKSTMAKKLAGEQHITHLDLDTLAWQNTNPPSRKPIVESHQLIEQFLHKNTAWVIEGCYADLLQMVAPKASHAVFMNLSVKDCQENAKNRPWEPHKYKSKAAQDANLPMLLDWIAAYESRDDVFSFHAHEELYNAFSGHKQQTTKNPS